MPELMSFDDVAKELETTTEEVSRLVSNGKLQTAEEGGLLMVTRESLDAHKAEREGAPLELTEPPEEAQAVPTSSLAAEEVAEEVPAAEPTEAAPPAEEKTESIFGDEFELETFREAGVEEAPGEELAELEEVGEELGAEEIAELAAPEEARARLRAMAPAPETSTSMTVLVVVTFIVLLFAGVVIFNFAREAPQVIIKPINDWLLKLAE